MDLIDRQALLKQIDIDSDGEPGYYGDTWKFIDTIKRMPSALGTNLAEVGTDCISRQAAIDALTEYGHGRAVFISVGEAVIRIEQLPSAQLAQPEIIYCKDCKYYEADITANPWGVCCHKDWTASQTGHEVDASGWCYRAERREVTE